MKICLAQINPTVGAFNQNVRKIYKYICIAKEKGAKLVIFPELSIVGYPPKDLLEITGFVESNLRALDEITSRVTGISAIIGFFNKNSSSQSKRFYNYQNK